MKLSSIGEDALVGRLTKDLPLGDHVVAGAGDDCAVLRSARRGEYQLFKTDCIVEGVHFDEKAKPEQIGWKALARAVSDVAAMGGFPTDAVVTLVLPKERTVRYAEKIYAGIRKCAEATAVSIVGGETSRAFDGGGAMLSVAMLGRVEADFCTFRSGGRVGDAVFVTGRLGGSIRGHHLSFQPRVEAARFLVTEFRIRSMMDLSDGLGQDLPRLAKASGLGFRIDGDAVPRNKGCDLDSALGDGEDYELLFTFTPRRERALLDAWCSRFPDLPLTRIGTLTDLVESEQQTGSPGGWDHFG